MSTEAKKRGFFKGLKSEYKKVTWPKKREIFNATLVVLVSIVGISIIIKLLDMLFQFILSFTL